MREQQHNEFQKQHHSVYEDYLKWINPDLVVKFDQVRLGGDQQHMITKLQTQFLNGQEQRIPVSAVPINTPEGTKYIVKDGVTRTKAKQNAHSHNKKQKLLISTFEHEYLNYTSDQWEDLQDMANDHEGASPATDNDYINAIHRRFSNGRLDNIITEMNNNEKLDLGNPDDYDTYQSLGADYFMKEIFKNGARNKKWWKNRIKDTISKSTPILKKKKTYNNKELKKIVNNSPKTPYYDESEKVKVDWKPSKKGVKAFILKDNKRLSPNLDGSLVNHVKNSKDDYHIIISYEDVNSVTEEQIKQNRIDAVKSITSTIDIFSAAGYMKNITVKIFHTEQIQSDATDLTEIYDSSKVKKITNIPRMAKVI
jgi:hypothetical protein